MYNELLRIRLLSLLNTKGLSEYQVSLDLGRSQGYLHSITSGKICRLWRHFLIYAITSNLHQVNFLTVS